MLLIRYGKTKARLKPGLRVSPATLLRYENKRAIVSPCRAV